MAWIGDMLMEGLAGGIDDAASDVIGSAVAMTNDLNSVFDDLNADMGGVPTDFNVSSVGDVRDVGKQNVGGLKIELNISNFNNYSTEDITSLTQEIMETAGQFVKRKGVVFG